MTAPFALFRVAGVGGVMSEEGVMQRASILVADLSDSTSDADMVRVLNCAVQLYVCHQFATAGSEALATLQAQVMALSKLHQHLSERALAKTIGTA